MSTTATKRDYYEVLNVERSATIVEIKKSYRRLAMKYHPDRNGGDAEADARFRECAEAYEVLGDEQKRARYDRFGHEGVRGQAHDFRHADVGDIFSMFNDIFGGGFNVGGGGRRGGRAQRRGGMDLETTIELSLEEVAVGAEKVLEFDRADTCETCRGRGIKAGAEPRPCITCGGQGRVAQQGLGGMFRMVVACPNCRGRGVTVAPEDQCDTCDGEGKVQAAHKVTVKVPAGVQEGQAIRMAGEGEPGEPGTEPGDLLCYISIASHAVFSRHQNDLVCQVPVSFTSAALGGTIDVPVLGRPDESATGKKRRVKMETAPLEVGSGTQHGEVFKLKGRGLPDVRGGRHGDLMVQVLVEIPKKLSDRQRELLLEFAGTESGDAHHAAMPQKKGFVDKLKSMIGLL